ncbi:MAG: hypothetical protein AAB634_01410 [Patescibacteria group bacterium]
MANGSVTTKVKETDYEKNLKEAFGWEDPGLIAMRRAFGILKGKIKDPVKWQRKIRREWERRLIRQYKVAGIPPKGER